MQIRLGKLDSSAGLSHMCSHLYTYPP